MDADSSAAQFGAFFAVTLVGLFPALVWAAGATPVVGWFWTFVGPAANGIAMFFVVRSDLFDYSLGGAVAMGTVSALFTFGAVAIVGVSHMRYRYPRDPNRSRGRGW